MSTTASRSSPAPPAARLTEHYQDLSRQSHAAQLGMWMFLGSEVLLFAALFGLYFAYRATYTAAFREGPRHTDLLLGTVDTVLLISASFLVAWGVHEVRQERPRRTVWMLVGAIVLGLLFLVLKGTEYAEHFREGIFPGAFYRYPEQPTHGGQVFFTLYYFMTGLHAIHVTVGLVVLGWLAWAAHRRAFTPEYHTPLELGGMYWHLVDVIWVFLWPMFYLMK